MTFGEKLKKARNESGLKQSELAKQLNTTGNTISNWENNVSKPDLDTLAYICGILHVNASFFLQPVIPEDEVSFTELKTIKKYRALDESGKKKFNYLLDLELERIEREKELSNEIASMKFENERLRRMTTYSYMHNIASAGTGFYYQDIPTDTIEAPYKEGADFIIGVSGNSMEPTFFSGDKVYVKKCNNIPVGKIGIFTYNNECYIKEMGERGLISHNSTYNEIIPASDVRIIGEVIGKVEMV